MRTVNPSPSLISVAEASRRIGCSRWRLYRLIRSERFPPAVRMGESLMINVQKLDDYLANGGSR